MSLVIYRTSQGRIFEYFVIFSLIALASAGAAVFLGGQFAQARDAQRIGDIGTLRNALELYRVDHGAYPSVPSATSVDASWGVLEETLRPYISLIPQDPINKMSEEGAAPFVYGYYSAKKRDTADTVVRGPDNYVITFRLEKPEKAFRHSAINIGVVTTHGFSSPLELTDSAGVYLVRAP
ncbi:hypothetical protein HY416_00030 [Candidatus Kaiserbacteria bacterium]|nr:hypothetical protein [Candidatus Kaiserbacteria bacterium]